jgi:hypothetical protein
MDYIKYINHLKKNNIFLFDHEYRISFFNINKYMNLDRPMIGGANISSNNLLVDRTDLERMVNIALSPNPQYLINFKK